MNAQQLSWLAGHGIVVPSYSEMLPDGFRDNPRFALDAQPTTVTGPNAGIPAIYANFIDPKTIRVLTTPMRAAQIFGEAKKGDWTMLTAQFPMVESTGQVTSYGDFNNEGSTGSNYNWEPRQSYHFQTITQYGDRETDMFGAAHINYVSDLNFAAALVHNKFLNKMYFYGVRGLLNFGALSDPSLIAPITPTTKAAGGTTWAAGTAVEIFNDVLLLYTQLQTQLLNQIDMTTPMTFALAPTVEPNLAKVTAYTLASVDEAIKKAFPNLKVISAPEYITEAGNFAQLIVDELDGDKTAEACFTEKLRAGRIIPDLSAYRQKKAGGGWGTVIKRPVAIAAMLGM